MPSPSGRAGLGPVHRVRRRPYGRYGGLPGQTLKFPSPRTIINCSQSEGSKEDRMAKVEALKNQLEALQQAVPELKGVLLASNEGLPIAHSL